MDTKNLILMFALLIIVTTFIIPSVSALDFDNVKYYDENTRTVKIDNGFGFLSELALVQLNTPNDYRVGLGYQKVAEMTFHNFKRETKAIGDLRLIDLKTKRDIDRDVDWKYQVITSVERDAFKTVCSKISYENKSNGETCETLRNGTEIIEVESWVKFTEPTELPEGKLIIGLFTNVEKGDKVDWIPIFFGREVGEWAAWTADMTTGLVIGYSFQTRNVDQRINNVVESNPELNLTLVGDTSIVTTGKILNASQYIGNHATTPDSSKFPTSQMAYSWWMVAYSALPPTSIMISKRSGGAGDKAFFTYAEASGNLDVGLYQSSGTVKEFSIAAGADNTTAYTHYVANANGTGLALYRNGVYLQSVAYDGTIDDSTTPLCLGANCDTTAYPGKIDEFYLWNRSLTDAEILALYNDGQGLTFSDGLVPTVSLLAPANESIFGSDYSVYFAGNFTDDYGVNSSTLYIWYQNGTFLETISEVHTSRYVTRNQSYSFAPSLNNNIFKWNFKVFDNDTTQKSAWGSANFTLNLSVVSTAISIGTTLVSPTNGLVTDDGNVDFSAQLSVSNGNFTNATIYVYNSDGVYFTQINNTLYALNGTINVGYDSSFVHDSYDWNVFGCARNDSTSICAWSVANYSFEIDTKPPYITFTQIAPQFVGTSSVNVTLNFTAIDVGGGGVDSCWFYTSENLTNQTFSCGISQPLTFYSVGNKTIFMWGNDTFNQANYTFQYVDIGNYIQAVDKSVIGEGDTASFNLTLSKTGIGSLSVDGFLNYNGIEYTDLDGLISTANQLVLIKEIAIPDGAGSVAGNVVDWNWNFTISSTNYLTETENQTVYSVEIDNCTVYSDVILELNLYDEDTNEYTDANLSNIQIDLVLSSIYDSTVQWTYASTWNSNNGSVCVPAGLLNQTSYRADFVIEYSATDHVVEFFYLDNGTLSESDSYTDYTNKTLYLLDLASADSTTFLFTFLDEDNLEVPNAIVHVFRKYIGDGVYREVERGKQDDNGDTHLHLVEEDVIYNFIVTENGQHLFTSSEYNAKCLSSPCQIELEASPEFSEFPTDWDMMPNGTYAVTDEDTTRTVELTFTSNSPVTMNLTVAKRDYAGTMTVVEGQQTYASSGVLTITVPQAAGNVTYYAIIYRNGEFIRASEVDFTDQSNYYDTTGNVMGFLTIVALILMGAAEGLLFFVFLILALILVAALALFKFSNYAIIGFVCALAILAYKLARRGRKY